MSKIEGHHLQWKMHQEEISNHIDDMNQEMEIIEAALMDAQSIAAEMLRDTPRPDHQLPDPSQAGGSATPSSSQKPKAQKPVNPAPNPPKPGNTAPNPPRSTGPAPATPMPSNQVPSGQNPSNQNSDSQNPEHQKSSKKSRSKSKKKNNQSASQGGNNPQANSQQTAATPAGLKTLPTPAWQLGSRNQYDRLSMNNPRSITTSTNHKLRTLAIMPSNDDILVSSCMSGALQINSLSYCMEIRNLKPEIVGLPRVHDMAWASKDVLVMVSDKLAERTHARKKISILFDCEYRRPPEQSTPTFLCKNQIISSSDSLFDGGPFDKLMDRINTINSITGIPDASRGQNSLSFVTANDDKTLYWWRLDRDEQQYVVGDLKDLRPKHTAAVISTAWNKYTNLVYTAGKDGKIFATDLMMMRSFMMRRMRPVAAINKILVIENSPSLSLICTNYQTKQLFLFDDRQKNRHALNFGFTKPPPANKSLTLLVYPSLHPNGYLVSMGRPYTENDGLVSFWDMRHTGCREAPLMSVNSGNDVRGSLFHPSRNMMITMHLPREKKITLHDLRYHA
ncbi:uncharacterized protein BJ171DRAFT_585139 [Polychytrium aggregatum]|uniref:uncharacterized protein n=1 Tax=Polychytrium aggregatum TaxID=110093 RepID=UPI0022FE078D|nr:uncharacterized protein BJ171DRAFT_585139 [Polychytrium aggregatum]KAI9199589.1 hypothetical protein BJ171DRAFT_585139 [Polychytrium aggregatum]